MVCAVTGDRQKGRRSALGFIRYKPVVLARQIREWVSERYRLELMIGPVGYWDQIQQYQFAFLRSVGLKPDHTLLDIGCGPLSGGLAFIPYLQSGRYVGIDLRDEAITEAYRQLAKAGLAHKNPFLAVSQSFGREELGDRKFDYIWASQILYHVDIAGMRDLFEQVSNRLKDGGAFYGDIIGHPNDVRDSSRWRGFPFFLHTRDSLADLGKVYGLRVTDLGTIFDHGYPDNVLKTNIMLQIRRSSCTVCRLPHSGG